jgi:hypothetical protein
VWKALRAGLGWHNQPAVTGPETVEGLIGKTRDVGELLSSFGHDPAADRETARLMDALLGGICAEIIDFEALKKAVRVAISRQGEVPEKTSSFLNVLAMAATEESATAALNADPVHDQVPFVEQIPVLKNGAITWQSPVHHSLIRRRAADPLLFRSTLAELEKLFGTPHPARAEAARLSVLEAIERLRRELDRDTSYLPTPLQYLEAKLADYRTSSLKPKAQEWMQILLSVLDGVVVLRNELETRGRFEVRALAEQGVRYVAAPRIHTPGLTSYILTLLLDKRLETVTRRMSRSHLKAMDLIRVEVMGGSYDAAETADRLRRLEKLGFHIPSVVYSLLRLAEPVKIVHT